MIDRAALLVIDVQNGFISEPRELPVLGGANVVPLINALLPRFPVRVATQDWHPSDHGSFASRHPGAKPFDRGVLGDLRGVAKVYLAGLALDYCVRWSALDAHRLLPGAEVYVVVDATAPWTPTREPRRSGTWSKQGSSSSTPMKSSLESSARAPYSHPFRLSRDIPRLGASASSGGTFARRR